MLLAASLITETGFQFDGTRTKIMKVRASGKNGATESVKDDSKIIRRKPVGDGDKDGKEELVSKFWGTKLPVMGKSYFKNETIDWQSWYFRYIVNDTTIFPEIIVYDNYKHGYRLILTVSDLFEDSEP